MGERDHGLDHLIAIGEGSGVEHEDTPYSGCAGALEREFALNGATNIVRGQYDFEGTGRLIS